MKYRILLIFLCCHFGFSQSETDSIVLATDENSVLYQRPILEGLNEKYSGDEFDYEVKTGESQNLLDRFFRWLGSWLDNTFGINVPPGVYKVLEWLIYILMTGLVIFLLIKLFVNERFEAIFAKKAKVLGSVELAEEHIEAIDFDALLAEALREKNYRSAVRYQFLKLLKLLSQKEIIEWHFEKTNADYQNEIEQPELQKGFAKLAYLYDYVWYGEMAITQARYENEAKRFEKMNLRLGGHG